jgi:phage-related protein
MADMPVVFYRDTKGHVPVLEWLDTLPKKALDKCVVRIERLQLLGNKLRRPEADYLRDGIYELRARHQSVNYRILYFFHGNTAIVLAHGTTKEKAVAIRDIQQAMQRAEKFKQDPRAHTAELEL